MAPRVRLILLVALAALLAASAAPGAESARPSVGIAALGAIELTGSVMYLKLDDAGARLLVSTVRYPAGELRRAEAHMHELPDAKTLVHRLTRTIDDPVAVALSPDGGQVAAGCGTDVCIHDWGAATVRQQLTGRGRRQEIGALALRPDVGLVLAAQRQQMEVLSWDLRNGTHRAWEVAGVGERLREAVTPRLHGRAPWTPRWVGASPDGERVASHRDDGMVSVWSRSGQPLTSLTVTAYADLDPAFAPTGELLALRTGDERVSVIDVERERVVVSVPAPPSRSFRRAELLLGARARFLAVPRPDGVALHALPAGQIVAVVPVPDEIWRIAMSAQAGVLALATQHRVTLWSLSVPDPAASR